MSVVMGPVLGFQGVSESGTSSDWRVGVLLVTKDVVGPKLAWALDGAAKEPIAAVKLHEHAGNDVWRCDLAIPQTGEEQIVQYTVAGKAGRFAVPATKRTPRCAYSSCNGFSSLKEMKKVDDNNVLWTVLKKKHDAKSYHLMMMGGDQLYSDSMWETEPLMKEWAELSSKEANAAPCTGEMHTALRDFYFDLYCKRWSQREFAEILASIPTVMMWDDHDIVDGWGSYPKERQDCAVFQGLFAAARYHFELFQMQGSAAHQSKISFFDSGANFSYGHRIGGLAIAVADMRSERSATQALSQTGWKAVFGWIDGLKGCRHLYFMSSIPVVHPDFGLVERFLGVLPGQQELEDDLRDHWNSRPHKAERLRLVHRLLDFAGKAGTRVSLLSGDVHVAALGSITSDRGDGQSANAHVINQLTSSGIVHPAPPGIMLFALEHLFEKEDEIDREIVARMHKFPGTEHRFIGARNWLSLEPDDPATDKGRIWANWIVEGELDFPFTKVIHPCDQIPVAGTE